MTLDMQPASNEEVLETCLTQSDEICVLAFDILLICFDYRSKLAHNSEIRLFALDLQPICAVFELEA